MARGRGIREQGRVGQAVAVRSRPPAARAEAQAIAEMVQKEALKEARAILSGEEWSLDMKPLRSGGFEGDTRMPATDLMDVAELLAIGGDPAAARELVARAQEHQTAFLSRLEKAIASPRAHESQDLFKALALEAMRGARELGRARDQKCAEETRRLEKMALALAASDDDLEQAIAGCNRVSEPGSLYDHLVSEFSFSARLRFEDRAATRRVADLLREGGASIARGRELLMLRLAERGMDHQLTRLGDWSAQEWEWASRITRGKAGGSYRYLLKDLEIVERPGFMNTVNLPSKVADEILRVRRSGPAARDIEFAGDRGTLSEAVEVAEVLERWRGLLRDLAWYSGEHGPLPKTALSARAVQTANPKVIAELAAAEGAEVVVLAMNGSDLRDGDPSARLEGVKGSPHRVRLYAGVRQVVQDGRDQAELLAVTPLEVESDGRSSERLTKEAHSSDAWPAGLSKTAQPEVIEWGGAAAMTFEEAPPPQRLRSLNEVLGSSRCSHLRGYWEAEGIHGYGSEVFDTAVLRCPRCLRRRIAAEPIHRLPDGHELLVRVQAKEEEYLDAERTYLALAGGDPETITSIADLRARDGIAEMDPRAYAVDDAAPAKVPERAGRSMKSLMSRR